VESLGITTLPVSGEQRINSVVVLEALHEDEWGLD
jgi:hypothetical protein